MTVYNASVIAESVYPDTSLTLGSSVIAYIIKKYCIGIFEQ